MSNNQHLEYMHFKDKPKVLMINGVYFPEINGANLQCMQLIRNLSNAFFFTILAGTNTNSLAKSEYIDGVLVKRVLLQRPRKIYYFINLILYFINFIKLAIKSDLVHIHGFSKRNAIIIAIGRILRKKVILKMTSFDQDDPVAASKKSYILWNLYKRCDAYVAISPAFISSFKQMALLESKLNFIPNCVDTKKFYPLAHSEKNELKTRFGFLESDKILLFVGHFSLEKRPILAYETWLNLHKIYPNLKIIFIGITRNLYEVDNSIFNFIKYDAICRDLLESIHFVEETNKVDEYMKIADLFILPSAREGLPNALLEAMSSGLPCFVNALPGVTDWLIHNEHTGILLNNDNPSNWAEKISPYLSGSLNANEIGLNARSFVESGFSCESTSLSISNLYNKLL